MNKRLLPLLALLFISLTTFAQSPEYVNRGALGFVKIGLGFDSQSDLNDDLGLTFSQDASIGALPLQIGAGGLFMISRRILLGLEYVHVLHSKEEVGPYNAKLNGGFGEGKIGYALINKNRLLGFPYIGLGWGLHRLEIENTTDEEVFFGETRVPQSFDEKLRARYAILDIGVSLFRIPPAEAEGVTIGAHLGFRTALGKDDWQMDNDDDVVGVNEMGLSTFYLKISIGGGGFFYKSKQ